MRRHLSNIAVGAGTPLAAAVHKMLGNASDFTARILEHTESRLYPSSAPIHGRVYGANCLPWSARKRWLLASYRIARLLQVDKMGILGCCEPFDFGPMLYLENIQVLGRGDV